MKRKNKGFTLIELIVTVAIIAIFSGVVLSMIGTGANSYRKTSSTAKAQMETQDVMDQIQNTIIDINRSVYYAYGNGINDGYGQEIRNDIDSGDGSQSKTFFACSATELDATQQKYSYSCDIIEWDSTEQKLYYGCRVWEGVETEVADDSANNGTNEETNGTETQSAQGFSDDNASVVSDGTGEDISDDTTVKTKRTTDVTTKVEKTLLAEDITNFCVDVSKAQSDRIVRFQFTTNKKGKEITTLHTVNLRNQVQISKPEDGYGSASDGSTAKIAITNYPSEINPGQTLSGFSKWMNGNIDPSTVQWIVETGKGSFSGTDGIDLALTAADDASGEIRIYVQAQTTDGKTVKSDIVGIKVNAKIPIGLSTETNELLLAVGQNYSLNDLVKWKITYSGSDNNEGEQLDTVKWTTTSAIVTLGENGELIVANDLGTDGSNSTFTVTASYTDTTTNKTLTGDISIKLARLDLIQPTGTLYVGDTMPFEYEYKEGGNAVNDVDVASAVVYPVKPENATGKIREKLTEVDAGSWKISAELKLSDRSQNGYGTLKSESSFNVIEKNALPIIIGDGTVKDTIVAGEKYMCSYYNQAHFYFPVPQGSYQFKIEWKVSDSTDPGTKFTGTKDPHKAIVQGSVKEVDIGDVELCIGSDEHGFILSADMVVYDGDTLNVKYEYTGLLNMKVITNIEITSPPSTVVKGNTYPLEANVVVWSTDGAGGHSKTYLENGNNYLGWLGSGTGIDNTAKRWTVDQNQTDTTLEVSLDWGVQNRPFFMKSNNLVTKMPVKVQESPYTLELSDSEGGKKKEIYPDDEVELVVTATINGEDYTPYNIEWKCLRKKDNTIVKPWFKDGSDIKHKTLNMSNIEPGEYEITASYVYNNNETRTSNVYELTVKEHEIIAEVVAVNNKTSIFPADTTEIYLKLQNEKGPITDDVYANWSCENANGAIGLDTYYQSKVYDSGKEQLIKVTAGSDVKEAATYRITVSYQLYNQRRTAYIDITVTPLTMFLKHNNDTLYFGMNPEQITAEIYDGENDINVTEKYDVEWSVNPENDSYEISAKGNPTELNVKKNLDKAKEVTVTAVAKDKESGKKVCTASTKININNKETITKTYICAAGQIQFLEFDNTNLQINEIKTSYTTSAGTTVDCNNNSIPTLALSETGNDNISITMNSDTSNFGNYKYILISVDTDRILYNFYIYPVQNNVYDSSNKLIAYVPGDTESIKRMGTLISNDNKYGDEYTYIFTDAGGAVCELRLSVSKKPGLGIFGGFVGSSMGKWFMKRTEKNAKSVNYYRFENNAWRLFGNNNSWYILDTLKTKSYWDLDSSIDLFDLGNVKNTTFWQKWN